MLVHKRYYRAELHRIKYSVISEQQFSFAFQADEHRSSLLTTIPKWLLTAPFHVQMCEVSMVTVGARGRNAHPD